MNCTIIKATQKDKFILQGFNQKLCQLEFDNYDATIDPKFALSTTGEECFTRRINDGSAFLAVVDEVIVGYLTASINKMEEYRFPGTLATIESIFIVDDFRGVGIGSKLIEYFRCWAKEKKATRLRVTASSKNVHAIEIYKKSGFELHDIVLEQNI
jgi:GNAT superfamily N-acetyltransferase